MKKQLPHLSGRRQWVYTAYSQHYNWSTIVVARTIQEARRAGYYEAKKVFGNHATLQRDNVRELV
jgi:hypothetical protein